VQHAPRRPAGEVRVSLGFEFRETLAGSYHTLASPGVEHPMAIRVQARVEDVLRFALDPTLALTGEIDAQGFADGQTLRGTLTLAPLRAKIVWDFRFPTNDARDARFHGEVDIDVLRPALTLTQLPGSLYLGETEVARAVLRFDARSELPRLLASVRPR
jgi:hypothetical protein